jgi:hypothetical protein
VTRADDATLVSAAGSLARLAREPGAEKSPDPVLRATSVFRRGECAWVWARGRCVSSIEYIEYQRAHELHE